LSEAMRVLRSLNRFEAVFILSVTVPFASFKCETFHNVTLSHNDVINNFLASLKHLMAFHSVKVVKTGVRFMVISLLYPRNC
jgi:hypothetical protein